MAIIHEATPEPTKLIMVRHVGETLDTDDQLVGSWSDRTAALAGIRKVTEQDRHREA